MLVLQSSNGQGRTIRVRGRACLISGIVLITLGLLIGLVAVVVIFISIGGEYQQPLVAEAEVPGVLAIDVEEPGNYQLESWGAGAVDIRRDWDVQLRMADTGETVEMVPWQFWGEPIDDLDTRHSLTFHIEEPGSYEN